jgi:hypothetical protein
MNSNAVSSTGYTVRIKPFMLLASVTCQDNGKKCVVVMRECLEKE